jgi:hypothetical protein
LTSAAFCGVNSNFVSNNFPINPITAAYAASAGVGTITISVPQQNGGQRGIVYAATFNAVSAKGCACVSYGLMGDMQKTPPGR